MPARLAVAVLLLLAATAQAEIYRWVDSQGRVHFGDQPGGGAREVKPLTPPASGTAAPVATPAPSSSPGAASERERLERQRRLSDVLAQERAAREAARQQAEAQQAQREKKCQDMRAHLQSLEGVPVYYETPEGERDFLDDTRRQAYVDGVQRQLAEHCR